MIKDMDAMGRKCKEGEGHWRQMCEGGKKKPKLV